MQRVVDELETNEAKNHREAVMQEHNTIQQAVDKEIELTQAEQRERVCGKHQVRLRRQRVDRGD